MYNTKPLDWTKRRPQKHNTAHIDKDMTMSAENFIKEFNETTTELNGFDQYRNWEDLVGIYLHIHETQPNAISVNGFFALHATGKGAGTKAIQHLTHLAEKHQTTLITYGLTISSSFSNEQITQWYIDRGFKENGVDNLDFGSKPIEVKKMEYVATSAQRA